MLCRTMALCGVSSTAVKATTMSCLAAWPSGEGDGEAVPCRNGRRPVVMVTAMLCHTMVPLWRACVAEKAAELALLLPMTAKATVIRALPSSRKDVSYFLFLRQDASL